MLNILNLKKNVLGVSAPFSQKKKENITINNKGEYVGDTKHYPPATKEWFNSIYTYNKNTIKSLPSADLYVISVIRSYFNLFNNKFEDEAKLNIIRLKKRKDSMSRILVGKPEFKHTNDKVIITLFVYNREIIKYTNIVKKIRGQGLYPTSFLNKNLKNYLDIKNTNYINNLKAIYIKYLKDIITINKTYLDNTNRFKYAFFKIEKLPMIITINNMLSKLIFFLHIKRLIYFNRSKFNSVHILPLKFLLQKIYNKSVEFNIISLKNYNTNSSILTQIMAKKLRDRKNRLLRVLGMVMNRINMPFRNRLEYPPKVRKILKRQNLIIRDNINNSSIKIIPYVNLMDENRLSISTLKKVTYKKVTQDKLNLLLNMLYSRQYTLNISRTKNKLFEKLRSLEHTVLESLNNRIICGIRIEASGRLSKRLIASRAVFKMRQKGTIRNINSSYRGMSAVLLRGQLTSNVDFSRSKNKTRIGAFGLKGWIGTI